MFKCNLSKEDVFVCPMGLRYCSVKEPEDEYTCGCFLTKIGELPEESEYEFSSCNSENGCSCCKGDLSCEDVFTKRIER